MNLLLLINISLLATMLLCLLALWRFRWRDYSLPARWSETAESTEQPAISIIIPALDQGDYLAEYLPIFLQQNYPSFEIIVVDEASTDNTPDVLKRLSAEDKRLRYLSVPRSARHIELTKLALTLGVRSARFPWVVFTRADCQPASPDWLSRLAEQFAPGVEMVGGYANYLNDETRQARRPIFERLRLQLRLARAARSGRPVYADPCNLAVKKAFFMAQEGFANSLLLPFGEEELFVDAYATPENFRLTWHPDATICQQLPAHHRLSDERIYTAEITNRSSRRRRLYAAREAWASCFFFLFFLLTLTYIGERTFYILQQSVYFIQDLATDLPFLLLLITAIILPIRLMRKATRTLGERRFGGMLIAYAWLQPLRNRLTYLRRLHRSDSFVRPSL